MNGAFELIAGCLGAAGCWILWFYFAKEQRLDKFREDLFTIRHQLFCMAAAGKISFQDPSYRELRTLINGMIQFGHRISFRSSLIASKLSRYDPDQSNAYQTWRAAINQQPEDVRNELELMHDRVFRRYMDYLVRGSILLSAATAALIIYRERLSRFDIMDRAVNRIANSFDAKALEEQTYRDQNDLQVA